MKEMARSVGCRELFQGLLSLAANEKKTKKTKKKGTTKSFLLSSFGCKFHFITYLQTRVLIVSDFSPVTRVCCCPAGEYGRHDETQTFHTNFQTCAYEIIDEKIVSCRSSTRIYSEILKDPLYFAGKKEKKNAKTNFSIYKQCVVVVCAGECLETVWLFRRVVCRCFFPLNLIHLLPREPLSVETRKSQGSSGTSRNDVISLVFQGKSWGRD